MISYIQAIDVIRAFALQHVFVSKFNYEFKEQMPNLGTVDEAYPFLYVVPTGANVTEFTNEFDLDIYCVDRLQKDRTNTNFILNDCQQVLADLSLWLEQGQDDIEVIQSYPMTPINNDLLDYVAGWVMRVRIQVTRIGLCEIPFGGESPTPPTCPSGFVRNSDGSYQELVPSGGELVLPDTPVLVVDQNQNELANENVISVIGGTIEVFIEPCQDATVENSDQSYTDTVASGGTLVLPDITVTDSDGSTYTQPSVTDVVCTPNEIDVYINRILVAEDATEDVLLTLTDQEGNALIFTQDENALRVNIPECEDATVNINGIEVGTAPSGGTLDLNLIDQNSDEVPFVQLGSDLVVNVGGGTPVKTYLFDFYGGASVGYSLRKLSVWSDYAIRVRRSSDNATLDIGFVGEDLDTVSLLAFAGSSSCYVTIWYDQSGNGNHARQTVASHQPRIVNAGVLEVKNGKPALVALSSQSTFMNLDTPVNSFENSKIAVASRINASDSILVFGADPINGVNKSTLIRGFGSIFYYSSGWSSIASDPNQLDTNQFLISGYYGNTLTNIKLDGNVITTAGSSSIVESQIEKLMVYQSNQAYYSNALFQEIIHYPTSRFTESTGIENNINTYYGIY